MPQASTTSTRPVTSYFPLSGQTSAAGVSGEIVYAGRSPNFTLTGLQGKVALIDFTTNTREWAKVYQPWGINPAGEKFPDSIRPARGAVNDLTQFQKAGAVAVILGWTDVSDANAQDQYTPFSRPPQGIPGLYVGRGTLARLRALGTGAGAKVVLEAETFPDTPTDTLIATLPGATDEVVIVNTHTDGPNATEENGALGILALAQVLREGAEERTEAHARLSADDGAFRRAVGAVDPRRHREAPGHHQARRGRALPWSTWAAASGWTTRP